MSDFLCPQCREHIRVGDHLIFKVKNSKKQTALLMLSPQIGNYSSVKHPSFEISQGEILDFYCPLCSSPLKSDVHPNLAMVIMVNEAGKQFAVYFSRVSGEHSTYETDGDALHASGEDAGRYTYFKIGEKFNRFF